MTGGAIGLYFGFFSRPARQPSLIFVLGLALLITLVTALIKVFKQRPSLPALLKAAFLTFLKAVLFLILLELRHPFTTRTMQVRTNADNPTDAQQARHFGAEGIGLCRTEHMFFEADRIEAMRKMIMAPNIVARSEALAELEPLQKQAFIELFRVMAGYPVTIRLLDPPVHEFLPRHEETVLQITNLKLKLRDATDLESIDSLMQQINEKTHMCFSPSAPMILPKPR